MNSHDYCHQDELWFWKGGLRTVMIRPYCHQDELWLWVEGWSMNSHDYCHQDELWLWKDGLCRLMTIAIYISCGCSWKVRL